MVGIVQPFPVTHSAPPPLSSPPPRSPRPAGIKISHDAFRTATPPKPSAKIASIQRFVAYDFDAGDLGPSSFSVASVHRIAILDVRLLNIDRHAGNILVKKRGHNGGFNSYTTNDGGTGLAELVPIDHGLCLPESLEDPYFEWLHWPQAAVPFSDAELDFIRRLDPLKDADYLRSELPSLSEPCLRILILCTVFLKCAARANLCLADIGEMMTREICNGKEEPSMLETLCMKAMNGWNRAAILSEDVSLKKMGEKWADVMHLLTGACEQIFHPTVETQPA